MNKFMAWIELHQTLPQNKKTLRFKNILNIKTPQAVGHLCMLWLWALDNAQDGDLSSFTNKEIAEVSGYDKKVDEFIEALHTAGFIDENKCIHDWFNYAGKLIDKRKIDAERKRNIKEHPKKTTGMSNGYPTEFQRISNGIPQDGAGNRTVPNLTIPNTTIASSSIDNTTSKNVTLDISCFEHYEDKLGLLSSCAIMDLQEYLAKGISQEVIKAAIDEAISNNARNFGYIKTILERCIKQNIKTAEDWNLNKQARTKQKDKLPTKPDYTDPATYAGQVSNYNAFGVVDDE